MSFLMGGQNSGLLSTSSTSKTSSNASKSRHKASFKISSVTLVAEELSASGMRTPRRLSSKLSSMVCVRVVVPFHWFGAISASMVATLGGKNSDQEEKTDLQSALKFLLKTEQGEAPFPAIQSE